MHWARLHLALINKFLTCVSLIKSYALRAFEALVHVLDNCKWFYDTSSGSVKATQEHLKAFPSRVRLICILNMPPEALWCVINNFGLISFLRFWKQLPMADTFRHFLCCRCYVHTSTNEKMLHLDTNGFLIVL